MGPLPQSGDRGSTSLGVLPTHLTHMQTLSREGLDRVGAPLRARRALHTLHLEPPHPESAWNLGKAGMAVGVEDTVAPQDMATTILGFRLTESHSRDPL